MNGVFGTLQFGSWELGQTTSAQPKPKFNFVAHPVMLATATPIISAFATLLAHPIMAAAVSASARLEAHPVMTAIATIGPSAVLRAHPTMAPSGPGGQPESCNVQPQPTGIGSGGTQEGLVF